MANLSSEALTAIVFVVVLAIIVVGLLLWMLQRLRARRTKILSELKDQPQLNQDRAFNRLAMARREAVILAGQGVDVHRAQELIAESQGAFDLRQYDRAYQVAQSAHEALVNARQQGPLAPSAPLPSKGIAPAAGPLTMETGPASVPSTAAPVPAAAAIPKNRAESQFQIRLLGDELGGLPTRRAQDHAGVEAAALLNQASAAFDRGEFTEAFRLALRGRRTLGSTVESLPATGSAAGVAGATPNGGPAPPDPTQAAEATASAERCPDCGYPTLAGDAFCRGCGRPRTPLTCPSCGAPRGGDEPFCGQCGARFP